jgi:hypothetical protein
MNRSSFGRGSVAAAVALVALSLAAGPAFADTELRDKGKVGVHSLNDDPGVTCNYGGPDQTLTSFDVRAPNVFARNKTSGVDNQRVGWKVIITRSGGPTSHSYAFYRSPVWKLNATDQQPAPFADRHLAPTIPADDTSPGSQYSVTIKMLWYQANGVKIGSAKHYVDNYEEHLEGGDSYVITTCFWKFL